MIYLTKEQQEKLVNGENVVTFDTETGQKTQVTLIDGVYHRVATKLQMYTRVNAYVNKPNELNLTQKETLECMKNGSVTIYRSSGAKESDKVLTREEQVKRGLAREVVVICEFLGKDKNNPNDYAFSIFKDTSMNVGEELKVTVIG